MLFVFLHYVEVDYSSCDKAYLWGQPAGVYPWFYYRTLTILSFSLIVCAFSLAMTFMQLYIDRFEDVCVLVRCVCMVT